MPKYTIGAGLSHEKIKTDREIIDFLEQGDILINFNYSNRGRIHLQRLGKLRFRRMGHGDAAADHSAIHVGDGDMVEAVMGTETHPQGRIRKVKFNRYIESFGGKTNLYRCKYQPLAYEAASIARQWGPQSYHEEHEIFSEIGRGVALLTSANFGKGAKHQAIKYAARRKLDKPTHGGGVFCSMFVVACYQAAALSRYVASLRPEDQEASLANFSGRNAARLWSEGALREWNNGDFQTMLTEAFLTDARYTTPRLLMALLQGDNASWIDCGTFMNLRLVLDDARKHLSPREFREFTEGDQPIFKPASGLENYDEDDLWELAQHHLYLDDASFADIYYRFLTNRISQLPIQDKREYFIDYTKKLPAVSQSESHRQRFWNAWINLLWELTQADLWVNDAECAVVYEEVLNQHVYNLDDSEIVAYILKYINNLTFLTLQQKKEFFQDRLYQISLWEEDIVSDPRLRVILDD